MQKLALAAVCFFGLTMQFSGSAWGVPASGKLCRAQSLAAAKHHVRIYTGGRLGKLVSYEDYKNILGDRVVAYRYRVENGAGGGWVWVSLYPGTCKLGSVTSDLE